MVQGIQSFNVNKNVKFGQTATAPALTAGFKIGDGIYSRQEQAATGALSLAVLIGLAIVKIAKGKKPPVSAEVATQSVKGTMLKIPEYIVKAKEEVIDKGRFIIRDLRGAPKTSRSANTEAANKLHEIASKKSKSGFITESGIQVVKEEAPQVIAKLQNDAPKTVVISEISQFRQNNILEATNKLEAPRNQAIVRLEALKKQPGEQATARLETLKKQTPAGKATERLEELSQETTKKLSSTILITGTKYPRK